MSEVNLKSQTSGKHSVMHHRKTAAMRWPCDELPVLHQC